jgi:hypothetical protein
MTSAAAAPAPNYISTAFYSQYNLILFGGSALFSLAAASPLPILFGLAAELTWLALAPSLPVFRRKVEQRLDAERRAQLDDEVMAGMRSLDPQHTSRLLAVGRAVSLLAMRAGEDGAPAPALGAALLELEQLRPVFLKLCKLDERLSLQLQELAQRPPELEVARLSQAYTAEKDLGLRLTLHQSIKLAQKKIEQQARMVDLRRNIELKLSHIEQLLQHLANQQQMGVPAVDLAQDIRTLLTQVGTTAALDAELAEVAAAVSVAAPG